MMSYYFKQKPYIHFWKNCETLIGPSEQTKSLTLGQWLGEMG